MMVNPDVIVNGCTKTIINRKYSEKHKKTTTKRMLKPEI